MARNDDYINIGMGLDIADLKAGLQDAKSQLKLAESEFKKNTSALDKWGDSAEGVLEQVLLLNEKIAYQEKQMAYTRAEIEKAAEKYGAASTKVKDLTAKLNDQQAYLNKLQGQMTAARGKLNDFATGESLAGKSAKELADSVERLKTRLVEQETAAGNLRIELDKVVKEYGEGSVQAKALSDQIVVQDEKLRDIRSVLSSYEAALDEVGDDAEDAAKSLDKMNDEMDESEGASQGLVSGGLSKLKDKLVDLAKNGVMKVVDAFKQFIKQTIQAGMDFTSTMSEVQALSGATGDELKLMEETAREYGRSTTFSATEAAEALKYMALAGWDAGQSTSALGGILDLAASSGMELGEASDIVTDYLTAFGLQASDASRMADLLAYAQANANTSVKQLAEGYKNSAATLAANGQSLETVTALLATLSNAGLKGGEAGTALAAVMRDVTARMEGGAIKIGSASVRVADAEGNFRSMTDILRDVGEAVDGLGSADRADALATTFSSYSLKGINTLLQQGADAVDAFAESLKGSGGEAKRMSAIMNDNLSGDMKSLDSAIEDLQLRLFDLLEGPLRGIVQFITDAIPVLIGFGESLYNFFVGVYDATKPIWDAIGGFFGWLGESIGIIGEAYGEAAEWAGGVWKDITGAFSGAGDWFSDLGRDCRTMMEAGWGKVSEWAGGVWDSIKKAFSGAGDWFSDLGRDCRTMMEAGWEEVVKFFTGVWEGIKKALLGAPQWFSDTFALARNKVEGAFSTVEKFFGDHFGEAWRRISQAFENAGEYFTGVWTAIKKAFTNIKEFFEGIWNAIKSPFENAVSFFRGMFGTPGGTDGAAGAVKKPFSGLATFFESVYNGITEPFKGIVDFFKKLFGGSLISGGAIGAIKSPFSGIKKFFEDVYDSIVGPFKGVVDFFKKLFGGKTDGKGDNADTAGAVGAIKRPFSGLANFFSAKGGVVDGITSAFASIPRFLGDIGSAAVGFLHAAFDGIGDWFSKNVMDPIMQSIEDATSAGGGISVGMAEGIAMKSNAVSNAGYGLATVIADSICDALGIHSPSRVMRDKVGLMIGAGIVEGMRDSELMGVREAARWSKSLSEGLVLRPDVAVGAYGAEEGQTVNNITYNQTINSPEPLSAGEIYRDTRSLIGRRTWA